MGIKTRFRFDFYTNSLRVGINSLPIGQTDLPSDGQGDYDMLRTVVVVSLIFFFQYVDDCEMGLDRPAQTILHYFDALVFEPVLFGTVGVFCDS